jgi:hypothetical protein
MVRSDLYKCRLKQIPQFECGRLEHAGGVAFAMLLPLSQRHQPRQAPFIDALPPVKNARIQAMSLRPPGAYNNDSSLFIVPLIALEAFQLLPGLAVVARGLGSLAGGLLSGVGSVGGDLIGGIGSVGGDVFGGVVDFGGDIVGGVGDVGSKAVEGIGGCCCCLANTCQDEAGSLCGSVCDGGLCSACTDCCNDCDIGGFGEGACSCVCEIIGDLCKTD